MATTVMVINTYCDTNYITALIFYYYTVADINECSLGIHNCMQVCENVNGSYACSCLIGYALDPDGNTCRGTY